MNPTWLLWAPFAAAVLHIVEEFVWPGGFLRWYRAYLPAVAASFTPRFIVVVNGVLLAATAAAALQGVPDGVPLWIAMAAVELSNVGFHVLGTWRTRSYSPGVVTAVLLYLPVALYGTWTFMTSGAVALVLALAMLALGASYPLWSMWNHRRRARNASKTAAGDRDTPVRPG